MPQPAKNYQSIIDQKQRHTARAHAIETLREGTDLRMKLSAFVKAVQGVRGIKAASDDVSLADVFTDVVKAGKPIKSRRATTKRAAGKRKRRTKKVTRKKAAKKKTAKKKTAKKKTAKKKTAKKKTAKKKTPKKIIVKRGNRRKKVTSYRVDTQTVNERLDAIVNVLEKNGDWMKTSDIHEAVAKRGKLFKDAQRLTITQYLGRLTQENPPRVKKKGQRGASRYRAA